MYQRSTIGINCDYTDVKTKTEKTNVVTDFKKLSRDFILVLRNSFFIHIKKLDE